MQAIEKRLDLVMVPVPVPLYPAVVRLIAEHHAALGHSTALSDRAPNMAAPTAPSGRVPWSRDDYAQAGPYLNAFTRAILDLCSRMPGDWVGYRDAIAQAKISHFSARSQLGGLTRRLALVFGGQKDWPFEYEVEPRDRQLRFRMDEASASAWRESFGRGGANGVR